MQQERKVKAHKQEVLSDISLTLHNMSVPLWITVLQKTHNIQTSENMSCLCLVNEHENIAEYQIPSVSTTGTIWPLCVCATVCVSKRECVCETNNMSISS